MRILFGIILAVGLCADIARLADITLDGTRYCTVHWTLVSGSISQ